VIAVCVAAAMLAAAGLGRARRRPVARLAHVIPLGGSQVCEPRAARANERWLSLGRIAIAAVTLVAGIAAVGGPVGIGLGLAGAAFVVFLRPRPTAPAVNPDDIPVVVDLIAGCLAAGASMSDALDAAAVAADPVMQAACKSVAAALRSGAPPEEAWQAWLDDSWLASVARTAVRTAASGAAAAEDLRRTSTRLRDRRRAAAQHRVRQAAVWLVVPLGLCFLPAFVLVAVVPLVIGLVPSLR
jgi:Flp pilus assembly protein TadB